jgi:hypothetical protein
LTDGGEKIVLQVLDESGKMKRLDSRNLTDVFARAPSGAWRYALLKTERLERAQELFAAKELSLEQELGRSIDR